jgi:hypothetical protein
MHTQLTYNIVEQRLSGHVGSVSIDFAAGSGGRAGTTTKDAENWWLTNNPLATHVHLGAHRFGPLPQGRYYMHLHENPKKVVVRLDPFPSNIMHGRFGFLIHGRGPKGSHGCIVLYDSSNMTKIYNAIKTHINTHKRKPVLDVIAVGTDVDLKSRTAKNIC